jgi:hypothetical protein
MARLMASDTGETVNICEDSRWRRPTTMMGVAPSDSTHRLISKRLRAMILLLVKMTFRLFNSSQHTYAERNSDGDAPSKERPTETLSVPRSERFGQEQSKSQT